MASWLTIEIQNRGIASIPPAMDPEGEGFAYGTTVPQEIDRLNRIATRLGVPTLDRFIAKNTRGFQMLLQEAEAEGNAVLASAMRAQLSCINETPRWHEPETARVTINSLKEFITDTPEVIPNDEDRSTPQWVLWDLDAYDRILADLAAKDLKFAFVERN
jgi:hypothetical protein